MPMRSNEAPRVGDRHALRDRDPSEGVRVGSCDFIENAKRFRIDREGRRGKVYRGFDDRDKMHGEGVNLRKALRMPYLAPSAVAEGFFWRGWAFYRRGRFGRSKGLRRVTTPGKARGREIGSHVLRWTSGKGAPLAVISRKKGV